MPPYSYDRRARHMLDSPSVLVPAPPPHPHSCGLREDPVHTVRLLHARVQTPLHSPRS